ncbi:helix-turn-helix transcriptional regulator [Yinghuangia sp. ASG 101]|uniref:helix-turn-helix domain-containing protein n=1 Tax=Yinghuangia sp. ASG 101 TaxID=2896848 RepID=UPI001E344DEF|nr:helix-turn-helix transcriptional regulator [Yinghuangia sp. ASG 101]UGQ15339.1 helix-turn-helix transcriptional regulator [Yinghuangia sp. ASG 101]
MSREKLAAQTNYSPETIRSVEIGRRVPRPPLIAGVETRPTHVRPCPARWSDGTRGAEMYRVTRNSVPQSRSRTRRSPPGCGRVPPTCPECGRHGS